MNTRLQHLNHLATPPAFKQASLSIITNNNQQINIPINQDIARIIIQSLPKTMQHTIQNPPNHTNNIHQENLKNTPYSTLAQKYNVSRHRISQIALEHGFTKIKNKGFIYIIYDQQLYKIGFTTQGNNITHAQQMLAHRYNTTNPKHHVIHIQYVNNPRTYEQLLHQQYQHLCYKNEWFKLTHTDVNNIITTLQTTPNPPHSIP